MRAVGVKQFGGPAALEIVDIPEAPLGSGQVRIQVQAFTVNPTDTNLRAGRYADYYPDEVAPWIPGMDAAGVVTEVAEGVGHVTVGDRVMAVVIPHGAYSEGIVVPGNSVVTVPQGVGVVEAATLPMNGLTARLALDHMALRPGDVLAVTGAAGAFGGYVIELAKTEGLTVIADASEVDEDLVRGLGADIVVRRGDDVADRIREHFPEGVDGLADGSVQNELVLSAVKSGGVVTTVRGFAGDPARDVRVAPVLVRDIAEDRAALEQLRDLVEDGRLTLRVARTFAAEDAVSAHQLLEGGGVRGRIVVTF